jgi:hypothetical protein
MLSPTTAFEAPPGDAFPAARAAAPSPLLDAVLVVDDPPRWHEALATLGCAGIRLLPADGGEALAARVASRDPVADGGTSRPVIFLAVPGDDAARRIPHRVSADEASRVVAYLRRTLGPRPPRHALDAFGHASLALRLPDGRILWQTPLARQLLSRHFGASVPLAGPAHAPAALRHWVRTLVDASRAAGAWLPWTWLADGARVACTVHAGGGDLEGLVVLTEVFGEDLGEAPDVR